MTWLTPEEDFTLQSLLEMAQFRELYGFAAVKAGLHFCRQSLPMIRSVTQKVYSYNKKELIFDWSFSTSCECYNDYHRLLQSKSSVLIGSRKWQTCPTLNLPRAGSAMTVSTNDIHIIGGRSDQGLLKSVEYCEPGVIG